MPIAKPMYECHYKNIILMNFYKTTNIKTENDQIKSNKQKVLDTLWLLEHVHFDLYIIWKIKNKLSIDVWF